MSWAANDARAMAKKYHALAEHAHRSDQNRFTRMAEWWERRAIELDAAESTAAEAAMRWLSRC
jgi:hypothetical protein